MESLINSYYFNIKMTLMIRDKSYPIPSNSIKSIIINNDYDKNNMPIIYLGLRLNGEIYNKMVLNSKIATISFRMFKLNRSGASSINESYIEDNFTYIMSTDPNYNKAFEQYVTGSATTSTGIANSYMEGYIALMSLKCINDNKKLFNNILKNTDLISIIHKYTSHMTMCIEPLDNNVTIDQFIIPPITSITNLIDYINRNYYLYKSGYRFFRDFNISYLLSAAGNAVTEDSNKFDTVIISIRDPLDDLGKINSMELDRINHAYIIYVDANDTSINIDRVTDKQYNSIIGVDTLGNTVYDDLSIPSYPESTKKVILERTSHNNLGMIQNTKATIESLSVLLTVTKSEIDSTILTPNKEYQVRNFVENSDYNGKYILSYKKEVIYQDDNNFRGSVMFGLRKVNEE